MRKLIERLYVTFTILILVWFIVSYIEVFAKHEKPNPVYWEYNIFEVLIGDYDTK